MKQRYSLSCAVFLCTNLKRVKLLQYGVDHFLSIFDKNTISTVVISDSVTYIGSEAQRYAEDNRFTFVEVSEMPTEPPAEKPTEKPTDPSLKYKLGDTDGDGKVTILDATSIQRFLAGLPTHEGVGTAEKIIL